MQLCYEQTRSKLFSGEQMDGIVTFEEIQWTKDSTKIKKISTYLLIWIVIKLEIVFAETDFPKETKVDSKERYSKDLLAETVRQNRLEK